MLVCPKIVHVSISANMIVGGGMCHFGGMCMGHMLGIRLISRCVCCFIV